MMTEQKPVPEKRIADFETMAFGMFVHWGLYSQLGKGEWAQHIAHIPREEYLSLIHIFCS